MTPKDKCIFFNKNTVTHFGLNTVTDILHTTYLNAFRWKQLFVNYAKYTEFCSPICKKSHLSLVRCQAIAWTNHYTVYCSIYTSPGVGCDGNRKISIGWCIWGLLILYSVRLFKINCLDSLTLDKPLPVRCWMTRFSGMHVFHTSSDLRRLSLTWFNLNPSMDK